MKKTLVLGCLFLAIASFGDVLVTFNDGSTFKCSRIVSRDTRLLVVESGGRKLSIQRRLVRSIREIERNAGPKQGKTEGDSTTTQSKPEQAKSGALVLTDDNVVRTVPYKPYDLVKEEQRQKKKSMEKPAVRINVISQETIRSGDTVTFQGTVKNDMTETVHKLKMIVQALDGKGKVFAETASQIADSIQVGKTAPFSFQFKDPTTTISRFSFRFEGISGGTGEK